MDDLPPLLAQAVASDVGQPNQGDPTRVARQFRLGFWVSFAVVLGLFTFYALRQWQSVQEEFDKNLQTNAHLLSGAMQGKLAQYIVLADALAASLQREPELLRKSHALGERLEQAQRTVPGISIIHVVDAHGQALGSSIPEVPLPDLRANPRAWGALLQARQQEKPVVGPLGDYTGRGDWVLPVRVAYPAQGKAPAFWIGIGIDKRAFDAYWARILNDREEFLKPAQDEGFTFARQDGYVLARWPDVPAESFRDFYLRPQTGALVKSMQAHPGQEHYKFTGVVHSLHQERIGYWTRVGQMTDLAVSVSLPTDTIRAVYLMDMVPAGTAVTLLLTTLGVSYLLLRKRMIAEAEAAAARHQELLAYNAQLRDLAEKDYLTDLPNRRYLMSQLVRLCADGEKPSGLRFAVATLDLDNFKQINDTRGHATGDKFLKILSRRLQKGLRDDDILVRMGGDEFAVLLPNVSQMTDAMTVCKHLLDRTRRAIEISERDAVHVTASMGVAIYPDDGTEPETLLRHADQAMYAAKHSGKNKLLRFSPVMDQAAHEQQAAFDLLGQALAEQWLCLHYQPVIGIAGRDAGRVLGVEVLLRIQHPERGLITAQNFFSALDTPQLARPVGCWVLQHALDQAQIWNTQGVNLDVMVNISGLHFLDAAWLNDLGDAMTAHPLLRRGQIKIELTESVPLHDLGLAVEVMQASQAMGVRFALDDFGQGETTLRYLQILPVQTIKIDQAFVRDMIDDPRDYAIVAGMLKTAAFMGMTTVAEGVEDLDTLNLLASLGCAYAQGYGIARPMQVSDVEPWVRAWKAPNLMSPTVLANPNLSEIQRHRFKRMHIAAEGKSPFPRHATEADAESKCHLGVWLKGSGQFFHGQDARYPDFHRRHALIHELVSRARFAAEAGNREESSRLVQEANDINDSLMVDLAEIIAAPRT